MTLAILNCIVGLPKVLPNVVLYYCCNPEVVQRVIVSEGARRVLSNVGIVNLYSVLEL